MSSSTARPSNSRGDEYRGFLKQRVTMNAQSQTYGQFAAVQGSISQIDLRGLGTNQTLILVDGHRTASPVNITGPLQSSLNGIPLNAVERIEVLRPPPRVSMAAVPPRRH